MILPPASREIILSPAPELAPAPIFTPTPKAARPALEFFTAQIDSDRTRQAYRNATRRFTEWRPARGVAQLAGVQAFHVAAFVKEIAARVFSADSETTPCRVADALRLALYIDFLYLPVVGRARLSETLPFPTSRRPPLR